MYTTAANWQPTLAVLHRLNLNFRRILLNRNLKTIQNEGTRDCPIQSVISEVLLHWSTDVKKMSSRSSALHSQQYCNVNFLCAIFKRVAELTQIGV